MKTGLEYKIWGNECHTPSCITKAILAFHWDQSYHINFQINVLNKFEIYSCSVKKLPLDYCFFIAIFVWKYINKVLTNLFFERCYFIRSHGVSFGNYWYDIDLVMKPWKWKNHICEWKNYLIPDQIWVSVVIAQVISLTWALIKVLGLKYLAGFMSINLSKFAFNYLQLV